MNNPDSEDALESALMELLGSLGFETLNGYGEQQRPHITGRETFDQVVLLDRLRGALTRLNPDAPREAINNAVDILAADRSVQQTITANQDVFKLLKHGVRAAYKDDYGAEQIETVRVIDWNDPEQNEFLAVRQLWVHSLNGLYSTRPDVVLFVNGLPLVLIELKVGHVRLKDAFDKNLRDYRAKLSQLFWYNGLTILSNGRQGRVGSMSADWEHYAEWKKINSEGETGRIDLETIITGTCAPASLLDLIENFTLYSQTGSGTIKVIAKNHQYLGVNNAVDAVTRIKENQGRLGVFWHTQGSGKSFSMVFFTQKIERKLPGNWTFLIVTDREELDNQIYKTFADVGVIPSTKTSQADVQAQSGEELKRLLSTDHRFIFTLIQKFHTRDGQPYPVLSARDDIIVITDEAHRSQYDTFAANMRRALPNAAFIGFTGTPLIAGEEKTREVFGDYVSIYDFKQSVEDGATVPLYYENRIPQLQLINADLNSDVYQILDEAMLDDSAEQKIERQFAREYHLITRRDRLEKVAEDIVDHFMSRGFAGRDYNSKAMVVSIDRFTAVRMYDLVQANWQKYLGRLEQELSAAPSSERAAELRDQINYMRDTDMAVVISSSQNEIGDFERRGLQILPHRERIVKEDLATKFKDADDPFRIVFVCAMWMTGFDAPACSTIYLDKPMRNHTLMQTIARANRVFKDKKNGMIVDYIGVFRDLERALAIYGTGSEGTPTEGETPVRSKEEPLAELRQLFAEADEFCARAGVSLERIAEARGFDRERLKQEAAQAVENLLQSGEVTRHYFAMVKEINRLYKSVLPSAEAAEYNEKRRLLNVIADMILTEVPDADVQDLEIEVENLLDLSIEAMEYVIEGGVDDPHRQQDITQIDFDALKAKFASGMKRTASERLRGAVNQRLQRMVKRNRTRMNYLEAFQNLIDAYNQGAVNVDIFFDRLNDFVKDLDREEQRTLSEQLSEEELAVFDLLTRPDLDLTDAERDKIKRIARELLDNLKAEKLVLDWRKHQINRASVKHTIQVILDEQLPEKYDADLYYDKVEAIYQHVYESYSGAGGSIYAA